MSAAAALARAAACLLLLAAPALPDSLYDKTTKLCDFENSTDPGCGWTWGQTGHGFRVVTGQEIASLQTTVKGLSGPTTDANNNTQGHFLFLNAQPNSSESLHLISPPYMFTAQQCMLRLSLHTANGSIAVFAESQQSNGSSVPWELAHNVSNTGSAWQQHNISIGSVAQTIRIVIEVTNVTRSTGHVAIDNLQLVRCFHGRKLKEPELCNAKSHFNCTTGECIAHSHVCDLMKDCPLGEDEAAEAHCFQVPREARCDFQHDMCGFTATRPPNQKSRMEWTRVNGSTPIHRRALDHTFLNASGMYLYAKSADEPMGSEALLDSAVFNPPPPCHRNATSRFKNSCEIRFFYHQFGPHSGSFAVTVYEFWPRNKKKSYQVFWNYGDKKSIWTQVLIILPHVKYKYQIHMEARRGLRASDLALDDFTLSPECFGLGIPKEELGDYNYATAGKVDEPVEHAEHRDFVNKTMYRFSTCGAKGMSGPSQDRCSSFYNGTNTNVTVLDAPFAGVQRWVVPETGPYTVIVRGASGGSGSEGQGWSLAAEARAVLELKSGDSLYILVGQAGTSTCRKGDGPGDGSKGDDSTGECRSPFNAPRSGDYRKQLMMQGVDNTTGGGGGGGASFVFTKARARNAKPQALLVAGGGGGLGSGQAQGGHAPDDERQHGHGENATRAATAGLGFGTQPAGPGGGWLASNVSDHAGLSLLQGGLGGRGCRNSTSGKGDGGFGGGGGGCAAGGGGGGYSGGNAWTERFYHGEGGYSVVLAGSQRQVTPMAHDGPGEVIIIPGIKGCDCQYHCAALNAKRSLVQCVCPPGERVNGNTCKPESQDIADYVLVGLVTLVVVLFILLSAIAFYTYNKFQKRKELQLRRKTPSGADLQLRNLRNDLMTETNPNYEFAGERYTLKDLRDVPREHLRLTRALGQGAFGEVYEGLYKMRPGDAVEMPVAVKTLPELSTLQAENDFMLEALIMGKFNHPNIVHLIGVCFDKHPRYIVLELLSGGDLKTFLRESRPRNDRPSALNMKDLLMCCVDVAKGCKYLEENRFIHRDIAARNCLLTAKTPGRIVKIADFGMAREVYMSDYYRKGGKAMLPIKWMPPEAFLDGIFTTKTDVWSYGVLLWEVMSLGYMPYTGCANRNVMSLVVSGGRLEPPPNCPSLVYAIMTSCWHPEPPQRPDFATILEKLAGCLQDPETLATPLKPMIGLTESDADVLTSPPALSVAPSASTELSNLSSPVDQEAVERMERSPTADYLVPTMPLGIALTPSHVALPSAPPVPHRPPLGPAPGGGEGWLPGTTPTRSHSKQPLLQGDSRDSRDSPGSSLGGSLAQLANGKAVSPNPLPLDPALLVRPNPKLRTEADGAPSPIADAEITC